LVTKNAVFMRSVAFRKRLTFMKEKEEYLESIQSKLRKLLFEEIALEDARKMYN